MKFLLVLSIFACAAMTAGTATAQLVTLNPIEDAFVSSANATFNYGGGGSLGVAAAALPKGEFDALLKFNLASAKSSFDTTFGAGLWAIESIVLQLAANSPGNAIFNGNGAGPGGTNVNFAGQFSLQWMQSDSWVEGTGNPNTPTTNGVTFSTLSTFQSGADEALGTFASTSATSGASAPVTLNLTPGFLADSMAGSTVSLLMLPADSGVAYLFSSRTGANPPQLKITAGAVPEPGSLALLGSAGLLGLGCRRRSPPRA